MTDELKPCPFCACQAELIDDRLCWHVQCTNELCGCTVIGQRVDEPETDEAADNIAWDKVKGTAISRWNRRLYV